MGFILFNEPGEKCSGRQSRPCVPPGSPLYIQISYRLIAIYAFVFKNWAHLVVVSKYPFLTKKNQVSSEKCLSLGQGQGKCKMNLEQAPCHIRKQVGPLWSCPEDTG